MGGCQLRGHPYVFLCPPYVMGTWGASVHPMSRVHLGTSVHL